MAALSADAVAALCAAGGVLAATAGEGAPDRLRRLVGPPHSGHGRDRLRGLMASCRAGVVLGVAAGIACLVAGNRSLATLAVAAAAGAPYATKVRARAQNDAALRAELPGVLTAVAAELRAGRVLPAALAAAADDASPPLARSLTSAADTIRRGGAAGAALTAGDDSVARALRPLAAVLPLASNGARLAGLIERLAAAARADARVRDTVRAELAGPTASAGLLAALPLLGLVLAVGTGADPVATLTGSPLGVGCLALGAALDAAGLAWCRHIVRSVSSPW